MSVKSKTVRLKRFFHRVRFEWIGRNTPFKESLEAGHTARRRQDWAQAAVHFADAAKVRPDSVGARLQLGHALKETGRLTEAEAVYRAVARSAPESPEAHIHLGHALKLLQRRAEASESYARAIAVAPQNETARAELIALGSRSRLSETDYGPLATASVAETLKGAIDDIRQGLGLLERASTFPSEAWNSFRHAYPILRPPAASGDGDGSILVVVDGRGVQPSLLRACLSSITNQTRRNWQAWILVDVATADHPVASAGQVDRRFTFATMVEDIEIAATDQGGGILLLSGNARLDESALDWFCWTLTESRADVVYADHDHHVGHWKAGPTFLRPALYGMPARYDLASIAVSPAVIFARRERWFEIIRALNSAQGESVRRRVLVDWLNDKHLIAHCSQVLSSVGLRAETALVDGESEGPQPEIPALRALPTYVEAKLKVIIPTRDQSDLLKACVSSLLRLSSRPELLDIVILDNRSVDAETKALMEQLEQRQEARVQVVDEPFNWARFNNLGAADSQNEILIFANNDIEMLSLGWDDTLRQLMADDRIGVLGSRLLYPDRTVQHAGIVLGAINGRPVHEGRGVGPTDEGPLGRWRRTREAAAVTGAFMAVRSDVFHAVGGFNETLAIAYNDVDFCLRIRSSGRDVIYAAEIEAIHHESKTRGFSHTSEKVAWDNAEFGDLYHVWGDAALEDPYVNSHWTFAEERSFDGLRLPGITGIFQLNRSTLAVRNGRENALRTK